MKKYKISEAEALRVLVKNVNDRPNAIASYGVAKMTPTETKDIFDRQFRLLQEKHNLLADEMDAREEANAIKLKQVQETAEKAEEAAGNAVEAASFAKGESAEAKAKADEAKTKSENAVEAANLAKGESASAASVAASAKAESADAKVEANEAKQIAAEVKNESSYAVETAGAAASAAERVEENLSAHAVSDAAHSDIRILIREITARLNAIANSSDTDLDQLSEIVAYIKANKALIEQVTTNKVSVADIINDLTTNVTNRPLSAAQGVALKTLVDALQRNKLDASKLAESINAALATAKESGEFDGKDYVLTEADKAEIIEDLTEQTSPVSYKAQTLTEAQKAQARKNIGAVEDNELELLESITLTEPSTVYRTRSSDGRVYKLNRLKVYVRTPADNDADGYVNLPVYSNKNNHIVFYCTFPKGSSREMIFEIWKEANMWDAEETYSTSAYYSQLGKLLDGNSYLREPGDYGDYISVVFINKPLPAGTVINIYGRMEKNA